MQRPAWNLDQSKLTFSSTKCLTEKKVLNPYFFVKKPKSFSLDGDLFLLKSRGSKN